VIAHGRYDTYIRATARAIKSIHCSLLLRFDQEPNGDWYPWGIGTVGMHNTSAQYVAMWRHVWRIFRNQHVHNVVWSWSPNLLLPRHYPLRALYPGNHYVDIVGLDGYLWHPQDTVHSILGPLMHGLSKFASKRPWFVAETGVASGAHQAAGIRNLLHVVATNKHLHGFVYLDEPEPRADWSFGSHPASVRAFRNGIARHVYGHARH
jgi:beta-mannanase